MEDTWRHLTFCPRILLKICLLVLLIWACVQHLHKAPAFGSSYWHSIVFFSLSLDTKITCEIPAGCLWGLGGLENSLGTACDASCHGNIFPLHDQQQQVLSTQSPMDCIATWGWNSVFLYFFTQKWLNYVFFYFWKGFKLLNHNTQEHHRKCDLKKI